MFKAEAYINFEWKEVYPEFWIMTNSSVLSDYLYNTPINKIDLRCPECNKSVHICSLGDGMKKAPHFAHGKTEKDEGIPDCSLRTESEEYKEIFKFDKPRANTFESALHKEMKIFAVTKFWSKQNKYTVLKEEDVITFNRFENTKFRADLLIQPCYPNPDIVIQRSEQYIFEGQTIKNPLSVQYIEKANEYKKVGFLEENVINAYTLEHLNRATFLTDNYIDVMKLQNQNKTEIDAQISRNRESRGSIIDMMEFMPIEKLSGYYAFHSDTEFLFALKNFSKNHLLFMHIPISEYKNNKGERIYELEEKNRHKRKLILASVLNTITIKDDYCVIAYLYFNDITNINDITEYHQRLDMYKNKIVDVCQESISKLYERYTNDIKSIKFEYSAKIDEVKQAKLILECQITRLTNTIKDLEEELKKSKENISQLKSYYNKAVEVAKANLEKDIKEKLDKEYKSYYDKTYEEIKIQVEKVVKENISKEYSDKFSAFNDAHNNISNRLHCEKAHRKYLLSIKDIDQQVIDEKIRCPKINKISLSEYIKDYENINTFECGKCKILSIAN